MKNKRRRAKVKCRTDLEHIRPPRDAAVEVHLAAARRRAHDVAQHLDGGGRRVQLPRAVVRHLRPQGTRREARGEKEG